MNPILHCPWMLGLGPTLASTGELTKRLGRDELEEHTQGILCCENVAAFLGFSFLFLLCKTKKTCLKLRINCYIQHRERPVTWCHEQTWQHPWHARRLHSGARTRTSCSTKQKHVANLTLNLMPCNKLSNVPGLLTYLPLSLMLLLNFDEVKSCMQFDEVIMPK
jgi:hypothetical protein